MTRLNRFLSVILVVVLLISAVSLFPLRTSVNAAEDSIVAIDTELKNEADLAMFEGYGCTPALKVIDGEVVGITMGGATSAMGYPYMLFGQSNWKDYTLEFTSHDMTRVGGIVRSTGGITHLDGFGGLIAAYEGLQATPTLTAKYSTVNGNTASITTIKDGKTPTAVMSHDGEIRFKITVKGTSMTCEARYVEEGKTVTKNISVDTSSSGKTAGKPGFRAVFRQVNGEQSNGYFSDLKVTLHGYTASEYRAEQASDSVVVIDNALTDSSALSMFQGYGCTPAMKVIDGETVGITMGGATSAMGYPYLLFGEDHWQDYTVEFDSHGMNRVGGVVRSRGGIAHTDGTGGINVVYEGLQSPAKLYSHYATVDADGNRKANTITTGEPYSTNFTYDGDMHFSITVKGSRIDCTVSYVENGTEQSHSITVYTHNTTKTAGKAALRAVYRQVNGEQAEGYFTNLKVTLHGDTATRYRMENITDRYVAIKDDLKSESSLALFEGYGCTPELKAIDGEVVGITMGGANGDVGYPYLLFGEEDWEDYILEFTAYGMNRVGGVVRITDPIAQTDGYNGIVAAYEGLQTPGKLMSLYSTLNAAGTSGTSTQLTGYGTPYVNFNVNKNYNQAMKFKITVMDDLLVCTVSYDGTGVTAMQTISINTAESGKSAGMLALRAVYRQVNGEQADGYFSNLKVTLLGDTAVRYKEQHPVEPTVTLGDIDGNSIVDNRDMTLLVRHLAGWDVDSVTVKNSDMDENGRINNRDAIKLVGVLSEEVVSDDVYKYVVIVGIDGAGAFFERTPTPNIDAIFADGAITYNARSTTPSISAQAWTSLLHGVTPEYHGRTNQNTGVELYPTDSPFPSVFKVIREQMPDASLASISSWTNINYGMIEDGYGVFKANCGGSDQKVVKTVEEHVGSSVLNGDGAPTLLFIHLTEPDDTGHSVGWGTDAYLQKITYQDTLVKRIYDTYDSLGVLDDTLFILATDHGGVGTSHGGDTEDEMRVLFAAKGKTVEQGTIGEMDVRDTAAIVLHALGLEQPENMTARVPSSLFVGVEASERPVYEGPESARNHVHAPTPIEGSDGYITNYVDTPLSYYLTFDNTADDECGNKTSVHNDVSYVEGYYGNAVSLKDGYVSIEDFSVGTDSFSVSFWMKTKGVSADPAIFSNKNWASGRNQGFVLAINSSKMLKFNVGNGTDRADLNSSMPVDFVDGWMHVTLVVDRRAGEIRLAYDFGEFETLTLPDSLKNLSFDAYDVLNIGQDGTGELNLKLSVSLDEFMVFDGVLTSDDLSSLARYYGKK